MKKKNLSAKPRMIACNPNRSSSRNKTYCEVQASHPWLSNKFLILMEDLSSSISLHRLLVLASPAIVFPHNVAPTNLFKGRREWSGMKEKNLSAKPRMIACNPIIDHIQGAAAGKSYLATGHGSYSHGRPLFRSFSISNPCTDELGEEDKV
ncbi:hypothetical protein V6N13_086708 [Hibiscus sabdariffa]